MVVWDTQALNMRVVLRPDSREANSMDAKGCTAQRDGAALKCRGLGAF